jgi:haloalkane dehalogenase
MRIWLAEMKLERITLVCQDWGGLIGLRLLAEDPDRFARVVAANTGLPTGDHSLPEALTAWQNLAREIPEFTVGKIVRGGCQRELPKEVVAAYDAPFPDESYKEGARIFPSLIPTTPDNPASPANRRAWEVLYEFEKPFLTAFSNGDPITRGGESIFQKHIPGAKGQPHTTIEGGGHFLQEDCGEEFARVVVDFIAGTAD